MVSRRFTVFFLDRKAKGAVGEHDTVEVCDHLSDHAFGALAHRRGAVGADDGEGFLFRFHVHIVPQYLEVVNGNVRLV